FVILCLTKKSVRSSMHSKMNKMQTKKIPKKFPKNLSSMRAYQKTHPWITFKADLRRMPVATWILLGEAQSKCLHISNVPLKPELAQILHATYLVVASFLAD